MSINWEELEAKYSFKQVEDGEYTTQVVKIEVADQPSQGGSYAINFELKPLDLVPFPYSNSHWLSFKEGKDGWRQHHMKSLLTDMSVAEEKARKKIEECEEAGTKDQIVEAYRKMFNALAKTEPKAKVIVRTEPYKYHDKETGYEELRSDGHRTEFAGDSGMPPQTMEQLKERYPQLPVKGESSPVEEAIEDMGGEEVSMKDVPF